MDLGVWHGAGVGAACRHQRQLGASVQDGRDPALNLRIGPNPARDFLDIDGSGLRIAGFLQLFATKGSLQSEAKRRPSQGLRWDMKELPRGIYLLHVTDGRRSLTKRIVLH